MNRKTTLICQVIIILAIVGLASPLAVGQLNNFTAQVAVYKKLNSTAAAGQFAPTGSINPSTQAVTVSLAGTHSFVATFASLQKTWWGTYWGNATSGSTKVVIFLAPLEGGQWSYATAVQGFVPRSKSVTVTLGVGSQSGSATVNAHIF